MSEYSQALSTCSRTCDFSFAFNNDAFSDAVLVLLVQRPKGASISRRLISSVAQLWLSAAQVTASTVANTVAGAVPAGDALHAASKLLDKYGGDAVSWLAPKDAQELAIANVYQVNSALLAASSPYLRQLIQQPQALAHLAPGLPMVAARHRGRKLVAVVLQPQHLAAAEAVVRFIFTNDIALTSGQEALHALLVAEQLQVPDCAEVCQHYLEDCAMDMGVALTLVHLQHKHQQERHHHQQQQWLLQQQLPLPAAGAAAAANKGAAAPSLASTRRASLTLPRTGSVLRRGGNALDAISPLLPVPSESVYLQGLLLRAQDYLLRQFEDLELVLGSAEGRQQLLLLPYDALKAILQHPRLKVASENSALLAAAGWLAANTRQVNTLLLGPHGSHSGSSSGAVGAGSSGGGAPHKQAAGVEERAQAVYNSSLYNSNSSDVGASKAEGAHAGKAPPPAAAAAEAARQPGTPDAAAAVQPQQHQLPTASGVAALLLDLCQVLRLCQLSYTYAMHVLPHLPLFRDQPQLVAALQYEVLRYQAAGELRQRRLASEAAAAMNDAAASAGPPASLTAAGLQQQAAGGASAGGGDAAAHNGHAAAGAGSPAGVAAWVSATAQARASRPVHGWRAYDGSADASLLQCVRRPESALSALDFTFTFEPAALAGGQRTKPGSKRASTQQGGAPAADSANHGSSSSGGGNASAANAAAGAAVAAAGSGGVDLMQRLLGLASQQQEHADTLLSADHHFAGYVWNMVVAADGFVGISWRVVLPGGEEVALGGLPPCQPPQQVTKQQQAAAAAAAPAAAAAAAAPAGGSGDAATGGAGCRMGARDVKLFGPDCAGFRSPEVAVTFTITSSGLSRAQRSSSGHSFATGTVFPSGSVGSLAGGPGAGASPPAAAPASSGPKGAGAAAAAAAASTAAAGGSPVKSSSAAAGTPGIKAKVGRAYNEVQFVPARCAWGFTDFAGRVNGGAAGASGGGSIWDALKGPDGKVCLRCQLKHRE